MLKKSTTLGMSESFSTWEVLKRLLRALKQWEGVSHRALSYSGPLSASWLLQHGALTALKPGAEHVTPFSSSPRCFGYSDKGFLIKTI